MVRIDHKHVLLIEDKTETSTHDDQLARYWEVVTEGQTGFGEVLGEDCWPIYFKTGNQSPERRKWIEECDFRVFDRSDCLRVLNTYQGRNAVLLDFRNHLKRWQQETNTYNQWTRESEKTRLGWEGLYGYIEENLRKNAGETGPLRDMVNEYTGVEIEPSETSKNNSFAVWITNETISVRMYGAKTRHSIKGMNREKNYWSNALVEHGEGLLDRPQHGLKATASKPMCVAEWRPGNTNGWLEYGKDEWLDAAGSLRNIYRVLKILQKTISQGR